MATDVLSAGVGDDIGTELEGVSVDGGAESVVHTEEDTSSLKGLGDLLDVKALEGGVGGGFEPAKLGVLADLLLKSCDVSKVAESDLNIGVRVENLVQVALGAAVDVIDAEDVVAVFEHVSDSHVGGHAGGACKGVVGLLHGGKVTL